jgi:hypothetical protein
VPLGTLLHLPGLLVLPALAGGYTGIGYGTAIGEKTGFGVVAQITYDNDFIDTPSGHRTSSNYENLAV